MWCGIHGWDSGRRSRRGRSADRAASGGQSFRWDRGDWQRSHGGRGARRRSEDADDGDPFGFAAMGEEIGRGMADMGAQMGEQFHRDQRAAHLRRMRQRRDARRDAQAARRDARRQARQARHGCGNHGIWSYWWLVFPLVFWVLPAFGHTIGRIAGDVGRAAERVVELSPLTPVAELTAQALRIDTGQATVLILAALAVNGAVLVYALRQSDPDRRA